jgi:hypothetical protein
VAGGAGIGLVLNVGGGISAAGGITFSNLTRVSNTTAASSISSAALTVAGGAGIAGGLIVGGGVGVGTAPTSAKLEILGSTVAQAEALRLSTGTSSQVGLKLYEDTDSANFLRFRPFPSPQKGFIFSDDADTPILTVDSLNDRVGIGTATPSQALDVVGSIKVSVGITIGTSQLAAPSGTAPIFGVRAWGEVAENGTFVAGGNILSTSFTSPVYTVTFAANMPNTTYAVVANALNIVTTNNTRVVKVVSRSASSFSVVITDAASSYNPEPFSFMVIA